MLVIWEWGTQTRPPSWERKFQGSAPCGVPVWGGAGGQPPGRVTSLHSGPPGQVIWSPQCPHHHPSCSCPLPSDLETLSHSPRRANLGPTTLPCSPSWCRGPILEEVLGEPGRGWSPEGDEEGRLDPNYPPSPCFLGHRVSPGGSPRRVIAGGTRPFPTTGQDDASLGLPLPLWASRGH